MKLNTPLTIEYYEWLLNNHLHSGNIRFTKEEDEEKFNDILHLLFLRDYDALLDMDTSRANDGCHLRDVFMMEYLKNDMIQLHNNPWDECKCSVLELMLALCIRMKSEFFGEFEDTHDIVQELFLDMLKSLGIITDGGFPSRKVINNIISNFIFRKFDPEGQGSLFNLKGKTKDVDWSQVPIWYQMMAYVSVASPFEE